MLLLMLLLILLGSHRDSWFRSQGRGCPLALATARGACWRADRDDVSATKAYLDAQEGRLTLSGSTSHARLRGKGGREVKGWSALEVNAEGRATSEDRGRQALASITPARVPPVAEMKARHVGLMITKMHT